MVALKTLIFTILLASWEPWKNVIYLCSEAAGFMTGQVLVTEGGYTAG